MKCMVLAGGFAKRMWPLTMDFPKSLLPVAGKPVIDHIIEKIERLDGLDEVYVSTNRKFESVFSKWIRSHQSKGGSKKVILVVEPALREEEKFGSIKAMDYFIRQHRVNDDVLVIGGDNLFSFDLNDFIRFSNEKNSPVVAFFDIRDVEKVRGKFGVCVLDGDARITGFQEKPENPKSTLVSTCIYHFPKETLGMISEYLADKNNPDAPGHFITWLSRKVPVYGFVSREKWYDIGSQETYRQADAELRAVKGKANS